MRINQDKRPDDILNFNKETQRWYFTTSYFLTYLLTYTYSLALNHYNKETFMSGT